MTLQEAMTALSEKGDAAAIAAFLLSEGITGNRQKARTCPVAVWLTKKVGNPVSVDGFNAYPIQDDGPDFENSVELPRSVGDFVESFDAGSFSELVAS